MLMGNFAKKGIRRFKIIVGRCLPKEPFDLIVEWLCIGGGKPVDFRLLLAIG